MGGGGGTKGSLTLQQNMQIKLRVLSYPRTHLVNTFNLLK